MKTTYLLLSLLLLTLALPRNAAAGKFELLNCLKAQVKIEAYDPDDAVRVAPASSVEVSTGRHRTISCNNKRCDTRVYSQYNEEDLLPWTSNFLYSKNKVRAGKAYALLRTTDATGNDRIRLLPVSEDRRFFNNADPDREGSCEAVAGEFAYFDHETLAYERSHFKVENGDRIAVRTSHNTYIRAKDNGKLWADHRATEVGSWEEMSIWKMEDYNECFSHGSTLRLRATNGDNNFDYLAAIGPGGYAGTYNWGDTDMVFGQIPSDPMSPYHRKRVPYLDWDIFRLHISRADADGDGDQCLHYGDEFGLVSIHGRWVSARRDQDGDLRDNATAYQPWERFKVIARGN